MSQEAQLGSQDELGGNHLKDLSVFLFCQGHCLQWYHKGKSGHSLSQNTAEILSLSKSLP